MNKKEAIIHIIDQMDDDHPLIDKLYSFVKRMYRRGARLPAWCEIRHKKGAAHRKEDDMMNELAIKRAEEYLKRIDERYMAEILKILYAYALKSENGK